MIIEIPRHSVVMLIGPSGSGKSYLATNILQKMLQDHDIHHRYLSSDKIRRELLGKDLHKHDHEMMSVSKPAFDILHNELNAYTQYPVNTPVVIVDATNLSRGSRSRILEIADNNGYNTIAVMFNYKDIQDYTKYADERVNKRVIFDQVKMLRKETIPELDRTRYRAVHEINSIDFSNVFFTFTDENMGKEFRHDDFCVFGDLHGEYDLMIKMLNDRKGIEVDGEEMTIKIHPEAISKGFYVHHVSVGDLIDKGSMEGVRKVIEFIHKNREYFVLVEGNHDRWVYNYLKGKTKSSKENDNLIKNYFDSVDLLKSDPVLKQKFFELYESMSTFAVNGTRAIITHAPCENKYLGKSNKVALKKQNTTRYPKRDDYETDEAFMDATEKFFDYLLKDGEKNYPIHVFGHVALKSIFNSRNKYGIDTGAVYGNYLSTLMFKKNMHKPFMRKHFHDDKIPTTDKLIDLFRAKPQEVDIHSLEPMLQTRLKWAVKNRVNFVSGTMSPTDKGYGELESLQAGIDYYLKAGVQRMMIQPKFMGSRCNLLLHKNKVSECVLISRNGYDIKQERLHTDDSLTEMLSALQNKFSKYFAAKNAEFILFDGELLPWSVMGKDLIESEYRLAEKACRSELEMLKETGFEDRLSEFADKYKDYEVTDEKMPSAINGWVKTYRAFKDDILHVDQMESSLDKYAHQLDVFGGDAPLEFKPFSILKIVKDDGTEEICVDDKWTNPHIYDTVLKNDVWLIIDFDADEKGEEYFLGFMSTDRGQDLVNFKDPEEALRTFWEYVTQNKEMEGVVIKPEKTYIPGVAPYLKCRNKEYLRLTYGLDYDTLEVKKQRLLDKKNIHRKLSTSIKEWELGRQLLHVPLNEISLDNKKWLKSIVGLLNEVENEKGLDPRL